VLAYFWCGTYPGHWVSALSVLAGAVFFSQQGTAELSHHVAAAAVFLASALLISWIVARARAASDRLREAYTQLHLAEALHRTTLEAQSDAVIRLRADGMVLYVNEAFCQLMHCVRSETVGRMWPPPALAQAEPFSAESLAALSPGNPVVESDQRTVTADGEVRWVHFVNHGAYDDKGRLFEVHSVGRDITERKQLEDRLATLSAEFEDLYEHSPAGHFSLDVSGKFIRINQTALGWLGCRHEDLIGKKNLTDFLSSPGRHLFRNLFPRLKHLGHCDERQFDLIGLDGTVRTVTMSSTTIRSVDDHFLATRSVINDVTEVE
jgi:PAS domain S-box-containing protein